MGFIYMVANLQSSPTYVNEFSFFDVFFFGSFVLNFINIRNVELKWCYTDLKLTFTILVEKCFKQQNQMINNNAIWLVI